MFGVLMVCALIYQFLITGEKANRHGRSSSYYGFSLQAKRSFACCCCISDGVWVGIVLWHRLVGSGLYRLPWIRPTESTQPSSERLKAYGLTSYRLSFSNYLQIQKAQKYGIQSNALDFAICLLSAPTPEQPAVTGGLQPLSLLSRRSPESIVIAAARTSLIQTFEDPTALLVIIYWTAR